MKRYRVILSEDAAWDMQEIHDYIRYELFSPKAAEEQYRRIAKAIQRLATFPHRCPVMISTPDFPEELRRLVVDRYVVLYFIRGDAIDCGAGRLLRPLRPGAQAGTNEVAFLRILCSLQGAYQ